MKAGFAKEDITPRVGVELCGFGPFLNRHSIGVRDRLWARATALEHRGTRVVVVSCDLAGVRGDLTARVRERVRAETGLSPDALMLACTHTHSGPNPRSGLTGWGEPDPPYVELLPRRIARAAAAALERLEEASASHAEVPCEGIGLNREYDRDAPPLEEVLREDWRPARPELTDTTCHVVRFDAPGRLLGFWSYFGCHPVVCCQETRYIHGDYCGVATHRIESEHPGAVGLFLQGANGDVNSCVVHKPEAESLRALDVIAERYARSVRAGLAAAKPLEIDRVRTARIERRFSQARWDEAELRRRLAAEQARLDAPGVREEDPSFRLAMVRALGLRRMLDRLERGQPLEQTTELHGLRLGPVALLASPFETFQAIKNDVRRAARSRVSLVVSLANGSQGYAPDRDVAARGGYAPDLVPLIYGQLPFTNLHEELVAGLLELDAALQQS